MQLAKRRPTFSVCVDFCRWDLCCLCCLRERKIVVSIENMLARRTYSMHFLALVPGVESMCLLFLIFSTDLRWVECRMERLYRIHYFPSIPDPTWKFPKKSSDCEYRLTMSPSRPTSVCSTSAKLPPRRLDGYCTLERRGRSW